MPIEWNAMNDSTAMELLELFRRGKLALTREEFDWLYDKVVFALEKARDELWRAGIRRDSRLGPAD